MDIRAFNTQNTGTFHLENVAFRSGDTNPDREQSAPPYIPYAEEDAFAFRQPLHAPTPPSPSLLERLYNLDTRVFAGLIFSMLVAALFHALYDRYLFLTLLVGSFAFVVYYVMSFFDLQGILQNLEQIQSHPPQQAPLNYRQPYHPPHYPIYRHTGPLQS